MTTSQRIADVAATIGTGFALFVGGIIAIIMGDTGSDPVYHAGQMLVMSNLFVAIYFLATVFLPPASYYRAPKIHLAFVGWMLVGGVLLSIYEYLNPGECCANPIIRSTISQFSMYWPLTFAIVVIALPVIQALKQQSSLGKGHSSTNSNYPRD